LADDSWFAGVNSRSPNLSVHFWHRQQQAEGIEVAKAIETVKSIAFLRKERSREQ
jgi:predicted solute-binding protein